MTTEVIAALSIAGIAALIGIALAVQVAALRKKLSSVPPDGDLFAALRRIDDDLATVEAALANLQPVVEGLDRRMPGALRHTSVVSYDAYGNQAGAQSRSIAIVNERGDGLVISLMVGRQETRFFTKMVKRGRGIEMLSPEEQTAVDTALGT